MRLFASLAIVAALPLSAAWVELKSGPFIVYSDAGDEPARLALNHVEQLRSALGLSLGIQDLKSAWPITLIVQKPGKGILPPALGFSRPGYVSTWPAGAKPPEAWFRQLALLLLEQNLRSRMPAGYEDALAGLYATLEVNGSRLTLGAPPAKAQQTRAWALLQLLATREDTATRLRVFLSNLANGSEETVAWKNAYPMLRADLEKQLDTYIANGVYSTIPVFGFPVDLERRYTSIAALPSRVRLLPGDSALSKPDLPAAKAAYQAAFAERPAPAIQEGLALTFLAMNDAPAAASALEAATASEGAGARAYFEAARIATDEATARKLLETAVKLNPTWPDPYVELARRESGPIRKAFFLKTAAENAKRDANLWAALGLAQEQAQQWVDAGHSWRNAEFTAKTEEERETLKLRREQSVQSRMDSESAARRKKQEEERAEVEKVRQDSLNRIREAEAKANASAAPMKSGQKVEKWWDGPPLTSVEGVLERVDCQGGRAVLTLRPNTGTPLRFLIPDPKTVVLLPEGTTQFKCGPQHSPRRVRVEYAAKADSLSNTVGEAVVMEFR